MNIWKVIQNGNSLKRTGRDRDGRVIILPLTTADEHIAVQRGSKARTNTLCYHSIPDDHATELLSFDDCNNKLKTLSIYQGYSTFSSSQSAGQGHSAFVSTARASKKMTYEDSPIYSEDRVSQILIEKRSGGDGHEMAMAYHLVRVQQFGAEAGEGILILIRRNLLVQQEEGPIFVMMMVVILEDAIEEGVAKIYNLITGADTKEASTAGDAGEFALMGVTSEFKLIRTHLKLWNLEKQKRVYQQNQLGYEEKIRVLSIEIENTTNLLKHSERINAEAEIAKKDLQTKLDNHLAKTEKWTSSSKNLLRLIDSSMSVRTKVGLGFNDYIGENELGWDDSAFSVFTTNSEEVEGRPLFSRFAKADSMKAVPPPLFGDYTPLSDHIDLDESQISYGINSSTSGDSNSMSNDFVSCDNSDKSSEVNINNFASSDSSVISSEPKSKDSTSCASTSSVSTSESEVEIESNVGTPIQEPIII
ncbi:hypothetical protein Tco_0540285 [Tanacetum coccineum]